MWGKAKKSKDCAQRFVAALNAHDIDAMAALMSEDFCYIDSWREGVEGRDKVLAGLRLVFERDPAFGVSVEGISYQAPHVLMAGRITSKQFGDRRRAVWRVETDGEHLSLWQSWADGGPPPMTRSLTPHDAVDMSHRSLDRPRLDGN